MLKTANTIKRTYIGNNLKDVIALPNLIDIQLDSYNKFLQREIVAAGQKPVKQGLEEVFQDSFPIYSQNTDEDAVELHYVSYRFDEDNIKYDEYEAKRKGASYEISLKVKLDLIFKRTGEIREKEIYMGDIPIMTERGTFIINGAERVVVSQIHRSPGVIFNCDEGVYSSRIIPYKGCWLEFEIDAKKSLIYTKIDRKKKILGTIFLRALGFDTREKIINLFYKEEKVKISNDLESNEKFFERITSKPVYTKDNELIFKAGDKIKQHDIADFIERGIKEIYLIDKTKEGSLNSDIIVNCFEKEDVKYAKKETAFDEMTKNDALSHVFSVLSPGEPITFAKAEEDLQNYFFSDRYDLGAVGRYKIDKKFDYANSKDSLDFPEDEIDNKKFHLKRKDIISTMKFLIKVFAKEEFIDDIDHLGNRRIRSVGELLTNQLKGAFLKIKRNAQEKMSAKDSLANLKPQDIVSIKPLVASLKEFFGSSQLSQFMDQVNPLAELTHKRRLSALGPGGLAKDRAGFEVRDVHYTHYGRMCPIETPEGPNIGLIVSLANYTKVNDYGFLETPYRRVVKGKPTDTVDYLSAMDEDKYFVAQANSPLNEKGEFVEKFVSCRRVGDYISKAPEDIQYMDVSPKQVISVATSLIPFLEHDDANRALMGSNMQRQAVPLLFPEAPIVGTGMEGKAAYDSGVVIKAKAAGVVSNVTADEIVVKLDKATKDKKEDKYRVLKFQRTNQDTCFNQRPIVQVGQKIEKGDILADGPAIENGELALGRNILVGFVPWNGYNYEDAILISERIVQEDVFTSIHIKEFPIEVRNIDTGEEEITRDIPNISEKLLEKLDASGVITVGSIVKSGDILVGKVSPKAEEENTPEFKLLNQIFGEKAKSKKDTSLRVPHGSQGTVIDVQRLTKENCDNLPAGVIEIVKVVLAVKRKLKEGDKMAGRHGNKGVVSRILPVADMPFLEDGTPLDVCLNPLGVPSRMNLGQLLETELGWAGIKLGEKYSSPVFQSASIEQIKEKLKEAGLPLTSKAKLFDGRTGVPFVNEVFVGQMYMIKLNHLVDDKMHARSIGPYSLVTQQPLGGKAQFGGQRLGEMEVWALEAYGASNTLQELMTIKSDDMDGRNKIYESIVKGEQNSETGAPESFNVLIQELRGLCLDLLFYDANGKLVPLTERDEELIKKSAH